MRSLACATLALGISACGGNIVPSAGAPFSETWQADQGRSIAALEERLRAVKAPAAAPVAVGVSPNGLYGVVLPAGARWSHPTSADTLPIVAGDVVVASNAGTLFALDAKSGKQLWSIPIAGRKLRGAGDDGQYTVAVVAGESPGKSRFLAVERSGRIAREIDSTVDLGVPTAKGGIGFIPWNDQYVSAVDLTTGEEVARLLLREIVTQAKSFNGDLWFGEKGLVRLDDKIRLATTNQGTRLGLPERQLPGKPVWLGSGNQLWPVTSSARLKIRLAATPTITSQGPHFTNRAYLASYFRVVLGLSDQGSKLRFVRSLGGDALGLGAASRGFAICDASGKVSLLSENGGDAGTLDLGARLDACSVDVSALELTEARAPAVLAEQIGQALGELTSDMAVAQNLLVDELTKLNDPLVTKILIDLTSSAKISPDLRAAARKLIATRRSGKEYMLQALERHYDYVSDVLLPPPLGPLADALSAMNEVSATPLLARHLNDPANDMTDVERAAQALGKLATPKEYEELRTFFALYRATADEPSLVAAVVAVGGALLRIGGEPGKAVVERAARDPLTQADVKRGLSALLTPQTDAPKSANVAQTGENPNVLVCWMSFDQLRQRLRQGRPLVMDADTGASFRARGVLLSSPGALGQLLRERQSEVEAHYRAEIDSRVDVLSALTADTTPRALSEVGMEHRAAQLTGRAVELALDATQELGRPIAVAGVLGSDMVSPVAADRLHEELTEHAARLGAAGCQLLIARGQGSRLGLMAAVVAAAGTELPTWAVLECGRAGVSTMQADPHELIEALAVAGAEAVLFEVPHVDVGLHQLERFRSALEAQAIFPGVLLAASESAVRGFDDPLSDPEHWVERAIDLSLGGARVIGGGAGTTEAHTHALALALGSLHPSIPTRRSDTELDRGSGNW